MATIKNLVLEQGATFSANIQYLDKNKIPIPLVGYNVRSKMRKSYDAANAAAFVAVITNDTTGNINLSLTASETAALEYGRYVYDVEAYSGQVLVRVVEGTIDVTPGVSGMDLGSLLSGNVSTSDLIEGNNLYYTNARVQSALANYTGNFTPLVSNAYNLGSPDKRWKSLYLEGTTIVLGNISISVDDITRGLTFRDTANSNALIVIDAITSNLNNGANVVMLKDDGALYVPEIVTGEYGKDLTMRVTGNGLTPNLTLQYYDTIYGGGNVMNEIRVNNLGVQIQATGHAGDVSIWDFLPGNRVVFPDQSIQGTAFANTTNAANIVRGFLTAGSNISISPTGVISASGQITGMNLTGYATVANLNLKADSVDLATDKVTETTNLYFTNARAIAAFTAGSNITISANGVISSTGGGGGSGSTNQADLTTSNVVELTNLYYTNARVYSNVINILPAYATVANLNLRANLTQLTTANVSEAGNVLYYTNARVRSALSGGTGVSYDTTNGTIAIGQNVSPNSTVTFANLNVTGVTNFYGNVITHSSNNLSISDNMIYLNSGSESSNPDLGIAGNYNDGSYHHAGFFRDASDSGTWKVFENYSLEPDANIFIDTSHASFRLANLAATTFTGNVVGNVTGYVSSISNFTTNSLIEGINLYYTNARVYSNVIGVLTSYATVANLNLKANITDLTAKANVVDLTSANVTEAGNVLYYTNARVYSNVVGILGNYATVSNLNLKANITQLTTAWVSEAGGTLYYTNARVYSNVINILANYATVSNLLLRANVADLTTANVAELTNLYYTNSRVTSHVNTVLQTYTGNLAASNVNVGTGVGGAIIGANLISANNIVAVSSITANTLSLSYRPAFRVWGNGSTNIVTGTTLDSGNVTLDYNQNSAYNTSTGIFTAPITGLYQIFLNARAGSTNGLSQVAALKNNQNSVGNILCFWEIITNNSSATHFGVTTVARLTANDNVRVKVLAGSINFDNNDNWGVAFIG